MKSLQFMMTGALVSCALLAVTGCDDDTTTTPITTASSGGTTSQGGSAGSGGMTSQGGSGGTAASGGQGGLGGGGGGQAGFTAELAIAQIGLNCQPSVPPDPLNGGFGATYTNSTDHDVTFTITDARAVLSDGTSSLTWSFTVTPSEYLMPPTSLSVSHTKDSGTGQGTGTGTPCDYCTQDSTLTLEVDWLVEGQALSDSFEPLTGYCAF